MNILILNRGSSTIKCALYHFDSLPEHPIPPLREARIEWKNSVEEKSLHDTLQKTVHSVVQDTAIDSIGHRIVHGGPNCTRTLRITAQVKKTIRRFSVLSPLHNQGELEAIELMRKWLPKTPQCAIFDTAFHHTLPNTAILYPGPYSWYEEGIRRYGFHGTSFQYCTRRASTLVPQAKKLVICHLGSGASLCAVSHGKSIDTTMGFTPLEGLMMDTRSGSIDPGILLYLLKKRTKTKQLSHILYERSGLLGLSGTSSDMRDILSQQHTERARLAFDVYLHRLCACIGSMIASLHGIDALIFTAGIGENVPLLRTRVCEAFSFLGLQLDPHPNESTTPTDRLLSTPTSPVAALLIHTQEAFEMARECWLLKKQ